MHTIKVKGERVEFLDDRFYFIEYDLGGNPVYFPSVSTILNLYPKGPYYDEWLKSVGLNASQIAETAAESGRKVHAAVEELVRGSKPEWNGQYTEAEWKGIMGFVDFCKRFNPRFTASEFTIISHKHRYAGTLDLMFRMGGKLWIVDVKFTNAIRRSNWLQLAAYKKAWDEKYRKRKVDRMGILHLKAHTRTKGHKNSIQGVGWKMEMPRDPPRKLFNIFLKVHNIYYYEYPDPRPRNQVLPGKLQIPEKCLIDRPVKK